MASKETSYSSLGAYPTLYNPPKMYTPSPYLPNRNGAGVPAQDPLYTLPPTVSSVPYTGSNTNFLGSGTHEANPGMGTNGASYMDISNYRTPGIEADKSGFSLSGLGDKISTGFSNWLDQPLTQQPILKDGVPTGQMSGSILGDLGTLGQYGMKGFDLFNQWNAGKQAKQNYALQKEQLGKNWQLATAQARLGLENQLRRDKANEGVSGTEATQYAQANSAGQMARLGLA